MIYKLMYRGAAYADSLQYQHCIDLWKYALQLRISKDTLLYCDTCFTAQVKEFKKNKKKTNDLFVAHARYLSNNDFGARRIISQLLVYININ